MIAPSARPARGRFNIRPVASTNGGRRVTLFLDQLTQTLKKANSS